MNKTYLSALACATLITTNLNATDLGTISIESSTIDQKVDTQKSEVSSVAVITKEDIEKINAKNVADILNTIPGVTLTLSGTDSLKVHIRGIDNQMYMGEKPGVAIVIDGVPVQETTGKINVDLDNIESIKVVKGGASYLYGNDAIAGAVIITTKRQKGNKSTYSVETELGSYGFERFALGTNQAMENGALQLQGSTRSSDGYWDDAFVDVQSINTKYQHYIDDSSDLTLGLDYTKRETGDGNSVSGISEAQTNPTSEGYYSYGGYYDSDLTKQFITYNNNIDDNSNIMLRVHSYKDDKNYKTARYTKDNFELWEQKGAKGEYRTKLNSFALMAGFDIQRNDTNERSFDVVDGTAPRGGSDGDLLADYSTKEDINALYTEIKYQTTDNLISTFNVRYDDIKHKYEDKDDSANNVDPNYDTTSYRVGFNYSLNTNNQIYTNLSTGFRTPTVGQISANNVYLQSNPTTVVPKEIDVEKTYNYEIGYKGKTNGNLDYNIAIFQLDRNDYIGRVAGSYITSDDEEESTYDNVGDMRSRGFELSVNSDKSKPFSYDLAYTYLEAKFKNYWISQQQTEDTDGVWNTSNAIFERVDLSGNYVSRSPKHQATLNIHYKATDKFTISPEIFYKGSYFADEANQFKQDGYTLLNLRLNYSYTKEFEFFGQIKNLSDKTYYEFVNVNSSALATMEDATIRVAEPRTYYVGFRHRF